MPAAGASAPVSWIGPAGGLVDFGMPLASGLGGSIGSLMGRYKFDAAVAVPVVARVHQFYYPLPGLVYAHEWPAAVVRPVFDRME